ncbi:MAG: hypothetical protein ACI81R_002911 [Bradymonadia bacterium]
MATRRRGGADLDDLKAKLGVGPTPAKPAPTPTADDALGAIADEAPVPENDLGDSSAPSPAPKRAAALSPQHSSSLPGSQTPPLASPQPALAKAGPAAAAGAAYGEDYSDSVSELETAPAITIDPNAYDPTIAAPGTRSLTGVLIVALIGIAVGLAFGVVGMGAKQANELQDAINSEALSAKAATEPVTLRITALHQAITDLDTSRFNSDFEAQLRAAMAEGDITLSPATLSRFNTLVAYHEQVGNAMVDYSVATAVLSRQIQEHLALTERENDEIQRLMAGLEDDAKYGVAVDLQRMISNYQAYAEAPEANAYVPMAAERVTYDSLDMTVAGEGDERVETFAVSNSAGDTMNVFVHDLILLERDQLLPPAGRYNAIDRYRQRAARIKESAEAVVGESQPLMSALESAAIPPSN